MSFTFRMTTKPKKEWEEEFVLYAPNGTTPLATHETKIALTRHALYQKGITPIRKDRKLK